MVEDLNFSLEDKDDLNSGLHFFMIGQHTLDIWKNLAARFNVICSGNAAPTLADVEILSAPDDVTFPTSWNEE